MGNAPAGYTIERIDNSIGYTQKKCRWASRKEQANNRSSNNVLTFNGQTKSVSQWAEEIGVPAPTLFARLESGKSTEDALSQKYYKNKVVVFEGQEVNLRKLSRLVGIPYTTIVNRYNNGKRGQELWAPKS